MINRDLIKYNNSSDKYNIYKILLEHIQILEKADKNNDAIIKELGITIPEKTSDN
ncbi:MAG: hypothetical protein R6V34_02540 [Bacteroidales bacterium]